MHKTILLTRPRAASERWAKLLARHGFDSLIEPLLTIEPLSTPRPEGLFQATLITSANALDALAAIRPPLDDLLPLPCFCVGAATGEAARLFGFTNICCGTSDSAEIAHMIAATLTDTNRALLHIAGDVTDDKAQNILAKNGLTLTRWAVYHAHSAEDLSSTAREALLSGEITAVPIFSPRSARVLVSLFEKNDLTKACSGIIAVGLSQAVADVLKLLPWRQLRVAASPSEEEVLACLQREQPMTQIDPPHSSPSATPGRLRGKIFSAWVILGLLLLGFGISVVLVKQPPLSSPPVIVHTQPAPDIAALEQRITVLETRVASLTEIPAATPPAATNEALADTVKNLQAQIALMQNQGKDSQQSARKLMASAFAFWDLREAAKNGRPFAAPLATLRAASGDNAAITGSISKLEPYATTPPPTMPQLRETLTAQETSLPAPTPLETPPSLWERVKTIMQPLVSVHPVHNPQFAGLETALDSGDAQAALENFKPLPDEAQKRLAAWHATLEARAAVDDTLRILGSTFTAPAVQENAP
ncbi:MAG: uroporphyrinogen-III synthase [Alphaproteobacteria bacterium]